MCVYIVLCHRNGTQTNGRPVGNCFCSRIYRFIPFCTGCKRWFGEYELMLLLLLLLYIFSWRYNCFGLKQPAHPPSSSVHRRCCHDTLLVAFFVGYCYITVAKCHCILEIRFNRLTAKDASRWKEGGESGEGCDMMMISPRCAQPVRQGSLAQFGTTVRHRMFNKSARIHIEPHTHAACYNEEAPVSNSDEPKMCLPAINQLAGKSFPLSSFLLLPFNLRPHTLCSSHR